MSGELEKARQQVARGQYKQAVRNLWAAEARARTDPDEARGLVEIAAAITRAPSSERIKRDCALLIEHAQHSLTRAAHSQSSDGTAAVAQPNAESTTLVTRANPAGIAAAFAGASALLISPFLPYADNTTSFARIAQNTMIQHGGWPLIVLGVIAAAAAFRGSTGNSLRGTCLVIGVLAGAFVYYIATDTNLRTLYPILNGVADSTQPGTVAAVGIGVYVAAVGAGLLLLASFFAPGEISVANLVVPPTLTVPTEATEPPVPRETQTTAEPTKKCPDCAETILLDARVCKHCGYRFEPAVPPT